MTEELPWGLDILVLDILRGWESGVPVAMHNLYAAMTRAHGKPPQMEDICREMHWFAGDADGIPATYLTWGFHEDTDTVPADKVFAIVRHFHLLKTGETKP
jgi:hypothetical protein